MKIIYKNIEYQDGVPLGDRFTPVRIIVTYEAHADGGGLLFPSKIVLPYSTSMSFGEIEAKVIEAAKEQIKFIAKQI